MGDGDEGVLDGTFSPLKFSGGRYEEPGYPLETLGELATYQKLLVEIARSIWLQQNPKKQRVPSSVVKDLKLRLMVVKEGSVIPMTRPVRADAIDLIDASREQIRTIFEFIVEQKHLPADLPGNSRDLLRSLGRTLKPSETLHVKARRKKSVQYTSAIRDEMTANEIAGEIPRDGWLAGRIVSIAPDKHSFEVRLADRRVVPAKFGSEEFWSELSPFVATTSAANIVRFQSDYAETLTGEVVRINDVTAVEEFIRTGEPWSDRLEQLLALRAGWLDGGGSSVQMEALQYADRVLTLLSARTSELEPRLFPTPDGGVQIEVDSEAKRIEVTISSSGEIEGYGLDTTTDEDEERTLTSPQEAADFLGGWSLV